MGSELANARLFPGTEMIACCLAMLSVSCSGTVPGKFTSLTSGSKPSRVTRSEYVPGFRSGDAKLPSLSDESKIGCTKTPPVISIRAPAMTAPDESWIVTEMVSECNQVAPINQRRNSAIFGKEKNRHGLASEGRCMMRQL